MDRSVRFEKEVIRNSKCARHHHQTVLKVKGVNQVEDDLRRKWVLTPIFPTVTLEAVPPS